MASVKIGVQTGVDVNGPIGGAPVQPLWDPKSGGVWALAWFVAAIIVLFFVL